MPHAVEQEWRLVRLRMSSMIMAGIPLVKDRKKG
jgi:hypothetical protein